MKLYTYVLDVHDIIIKKINFSQHKKSLQPNALCCNIVAIWLLFLPISALRDATTSVSMYQSTFT